MMKRIPVRPLLLIAVCALLPAFARPAGAEIYADVTLRHGDTPLGTVRIELDAARAPRPVANFIGLATGQFPWIDPGTGKLMIGTPYYDGLIFHRLIHDFMIQGATPRSWEPIENRFLVMNMEETLSMTPSKPEPGAAAFLRVCSVDYSPVPVAPTDIFQHGATLSMDLHGGNLVVVFGTGDPGDAGTWTYTAADQTVTSGTLAGASAGAYSLTGNPVYPDGSIRLQGDSGQFRYLSVRALYLNFGEAGVGPYHVADIETYLSFHHPISGFYNDDWYNTKMAGPLEQYIRGPFTWTPPE